MNVYFGKQFRKFFGNRLPPVLATHTYIKIRDVMGTCILGYGHYHIISEYLLECGSQGFRKLYVVLECSACNTFFGPYIERSQTAAGESGITGCNPYYSRITWRS